MYLTYHQPRLSRNALVLNYLGQIFGANIWDRAGMGDSWIDYKGFDAEILVAGQD